MRIKFPLIRYKYSIVARKNYLSAYASAKRPRVGEDWLRGSDLKDGKLRFKTLFSIIKDILFYDLHLGRHKKPSFVAK